MSKLSDRIEGEIARQTGAHIVVQERRGGLLLSGLVASPDVREVAREIAERHAGGRPVDVQVEMVEVLASEGATNDLGAMGNLAEAVTNVTNANDELVADFTDQRLSNDPDEIAEGDSDGSEVYFPPTDPVVRPAANGQLEVIGGFAPTADSDVTAAVPSSEGDRGDEALADAVREALRRDAATIDLDVSVVVRGGVVHLRGEVDDLDDAEGAEAVAARVAGIVEVVDELRVSAI